MTQIRQIARILDIYRVFNIKIEIALLLMLVASYGFFVISATVNGGRIERMERAISEDSSRLSDLEATYMALKRSISIDEAYERGFVDVSNPIYIARTGAPAVALRD